MHIKTEDIFYWQWKNEHLMKAGDIFYDIFGEHNECYIVGIVLKQEYKRFTTYRYSNAVYYRYSNAVYGWALKSIDVESLMAKESKII